MRLKKLRKITQVFKSIWPLLTISSSMWNKIISPITINPAPASLLPTVTILLRMHSKLILDSLTIGGFIFFEKVRAPDARFQDIMTLIYNEFKIDQGYTGDEIIAKSRSLKGVLDPFSTQANYDLAKRAGFVDIMSIFKCISFEGFLAIK